MKKLIEAIAYQVDLTKNQALHIYSETKADTVLWSAACCDTWRAD